MFWYIIILLIIILLFITFKTITESFDLSYNNEENFILKDYENIPITDKIYEDINELLEIIDMDDNNIINIINGNSGMGSQLTLYLQTSSYIHDRNSKIICLPHFSNNNKNFKYHNKEYNNSFFMYFKRKQDIDLSKYKIYFFNVNFIDNYPFYSSDIPLNKEDKKFIDKFTNEYTFIKNSNIIDQLNKIKKPLIGIHIRSIKQKQAHNPGYLSISIEDRLTKLKQKLDSTYDNYNVFIATDLNPYIELAKKIFGDIYYFNNITRIDSEEDIMSELDMNLSGYKLGTDILNECFALSMCDVFFASNSNIPFVVSLINPNIVMEKY